jgi:hypothetical protein
MADYYTKFSVIMELPSPEAQAYAVATHATVAAQRNGDGNPAGLPPELADECVVDDWSFEADPSGQKDLWLHGEEGGVDALCAFVQHLLQKFNPKGRLDVEWSNDCSSPKIDGFGGGAARITATEIKTFSTCEWLRQQT